MIIQVIIVKYENPLILQYLFSYPFTPFNLVHPLPTVILNYETFNAEYYVILLQKKYHHQYGVVINQIIRKNKSQLYKK